MIENFEKWLFMIFFFWLKPIHGMTQVPLTLKLNLEGNVAIMKKSIYFLPPTHKFWNSTLPQAICKIQSLNCLNCIYLPISWELTLAGLSSLQFPVSETDWKYNFLPTWLIYDCVRLCFDNKLFKFEYSG